MEINSLCQGRQTAQDLPQAISDSSNIEKVNSQTDKNTNNDEKKASEKDVKNAVNKLNTFLEDQGTHAVYAYHNVYKNDLMIKIVDDKTGQVIQEIPPKKILDMIAKMCEMVGVLVDKKA